MTDEERAAFVAWREAYLRSLAGWHRYVRAVDARDLEGSRAADAQREIDQNATRDALHELQRVVVAAHTNAPAAPVVAPSADPR